MSDTGDPALLGRTIAGKYRIEAYLGGGAMGAVYRARQEALDRNVAVKVLHSTVAHDPLFVTRFHREARAASRLDHPSSMRVVDFGEEPDGLLYIAMEYLEGRDLFRVMHEDWPLPTERIARILMQVLAALAVAHELGVVHRDLKPENIMILEGTDDDGSPTDVVKVCDFGIAKITDPDDDEGGARTGAVEKLTTKGFLVGTPEYMSPEQARGEKLDARSDLYAIGVILYQLLTGRMPFTGDSPVAILLKQISTNPEPPHAICPGVDRQLEAVCLRALAKEREARFTSAREMRAALRAALGGASVTSVAPSAPAPQVDAIALGSAPTSSAPRAVSSGELVIPLAPKVPSITPPPAAVDVPASGRRTWLVALGLGVAAMAVAAVGFFALRRTRDPDPPPVSSAPEVAKPAPALASEAPQVSPAPASSAPRVASSTPRVASSAPGVASSAPASRHPRGSKPPRPTSGAEARDPRRGS